jgi:hypothetical protein
MHSLQKKSLSQFYLQAPIPLLPRASEHIRKPVSFTSRPPIPLPPRASGHIRKPQPPSFTSRPPTPLPPRASEHVRKPQPPSFTSMPPYLSHPERVDMSASLSHPEARVSQRGTSTSWLLLRPSTQHYLPCHVKAIRTEPTALSSLSSLLSHYSRGTQCPP